MGNAFSFDASDSRYSAEMLGSNIMHGYSSMFEQLLKNQIEPLEFVANDANIDIYRALIINSPEIPLEKMKQICKSIREYHHVLPKLDRNILAYYFNNLSHKHYSFHNCKSNNSFMNIISISMDFGWTKYKQFANDLVLYEIDDTVVINVYTDTLRLASRIKNLVFRKFELDEQIINMLIDTLLYVKLGEERMVNIKTYPTDAKIANPTVSHEIFKCITEAKLFELQLILKSNQNQIFEFNGQTIWHRLAIASATYTLDAIIQLTTMLKTYCSQLNINKIASTNDTIGFVTSLQEKNLKITHVLHRFSRTSKKKAKEN